tara:strand:- start:61 stop:1128 length:1068 start_codon:yes stop_codon:yes gene_type:complete
MELYNEDCLDQMKQIETNSIDLLFADLPYGQTSCKWDCLIDLELFWKEVNRICKDSTPMFFTCSTKFGVSLINSNPKNFRYDMVWIKSAPCGFLNAKKMPMKKHEMVYVFYRKLPFYDLSSHKHKFIKEEEDKYIISETYGNGGKDTQNKTPRKHKILYKKSEYEPTLPTSVIRETTTNECYESPKLVYNHKDRAEAIYDPPLPTSVIRTDAGCNGMYGKETGKIFIYDEKGKLRNSEPRYDPPLPTSVIRTDLYSDKNKTEKRELYRAKDGQYEPPLPNTLLEIKSEKGKHATQKPVALIEWCLKYYSKEGDKILDPTMGSGSTGVACKNMNRYFIGIEKDLDIFEIAKKRLEN